MIGWNGAYSLVAYVRKSVGKVYAETRVHEVIFLFVLVPGLLLSIEWAIQSNFGVLTGIKRDPMWFELSRESYLSFDTIFDLYISSFAHSDWGHLQGNLVNYLFCMSALYPMSIFANKRKNNFYLILVIVLLSPIVVKLVSNVYLTGRTIGFSGILSGLFGLLTVVIFVAVDEQIEADFNPFWSLIAVFSVYIAILVYFGALVSAGYLVPIVILLSAWFVYNEGPDGVREVLQVLVGEGNILFPWALIIAILGALAMFYGLPPGSNILGHIVGYLFGWGVGFITFGEGGVSSWLSKR